MGSRFEKRNVGGRFKIRDTEGNDGQGKWATDAKVEELNKRAGEAK